MKSVFCKNRYFLVQYMDGIICNSTIYKKTKCVFKDYKLQPPKYIWEVAFTSGWGYSKAACYTMYSSTENYILSKASTEKAFSQQNMDLFVKSANHIDQQTIVLGFFLQFSINIVGILCYIQGIQGDKQRLVFTISIACNYQHGGNLKIVDFVSIFS